MKRLIVDFFKILYKITGLKSLSLTLSILYVSALHLVAIYGLAHLLKGWTPNVKKVIGLFSFPYVIVLFAIMTGLSYWITMPVSNVEKEKRKPPLVVPIVVYTLVCVILLLYSRYFDSITLEP